MPQSLAFTKTPESLFQSVNTGTLSDDRRMTRYNGSGPRQQQ